MPIYVNMYMYMNMPILLMFTCTYMHHGDPHKPGRLELMNDHLKPGSRRELPARGALEVVAVGWRLKGFRVQG